MQTTDNPYVVARRKEEINKGKELEGILKAICYHLNTGPDNRSIAPPKWFVEMSRDSEDNDIRNCGYLKGPNGFSLFVAPSYRFANKLHISVSWPRDPNKLACYFEPRSDEMDGVTEINVSRNKECRLIANDIRNRLLPDGMRIFARVKERMLNHAKAESNRQAMISRFKNKLGTTYCVDYIVTRYKFKGAIDVEANCHERTVDLSLSNIPPTLADQILALISREG